MSDPLHVYVIVGEPSGDILGSRLIRAMHALSGDIRFSGIGGETMTETGFESLFPMNELSVMGLTEVLPRIPGLLRRISETAADIQAKCPDVVVTIDAPDFCLRVAKKVRGSGIPIVHYVAPSVWAWRPGRAEKLAGIVDHVMCLLPFEPEYFEREGLGATFVGHSILESGADKGDGPAFRRRHGIDDDASVVVVLPGSRMGEISRHLEPFGETIERVRANAGPFHVVIPTVPNVENAVRNRVRDWPDTRVVAGEEEKYDAFAVADAALAASGTVSLELAMAGVPSLIAYRVAPLTAWMGRKLLNVDYVSIVNLILDKPAMPEFLQENCRPDRLAPALGELLQSRDARAEQNADIRRALDALLADNDDAPSTSAAKVVMRMASGRA